jgi:hypothetical protein
MKWGKREAWLFEYIASSQNSFDTTCKREVLMMMMMLMEVVLVVVVIRRNKSRCKNML